MHNLLPGLRKFSEGIFPHHQSLFEALSQGQKPHTLLITCSDSRIDPNLVTQTKPGEIFIVRNAGNLIPPYDANGGAEAAAIEFAVEVLGVSNIVICGHSQCGAMAAILDEEHLKELPSVKKWLTYAEAVKKRIKKNMDVSEITQITEENILLQAENLRTHPVICKAIEERRVRIYGWVYYFERGLVTIYDPDLKKFLPSIEVKEECEKNILRYAL